MVKFFLSLLYAEPHELGWDPTIKRISPRDVKGPAVQYDIKVGDVWYRTQRLLSNAGAEVLRGRGTRVWEARKLEFSVAQDNDVQPSLKRPKAISVRTLHAMISERSTSAPSATPRRDQRCEYHDIRRQS